MSRPGRGGGRARAAVAPWATLCGVLWVALWVTACAVSLPAAAAEVAVQEPRAFGYAVGDVVSRVVTLQLPAGQSLDPASLPADNRRGQAIELRQVAQRSLWQPGGQRVELRFDYQIFLSPPELRTLELPPIVLRLTGGPRVEELRVDAWPVTVGPLAPAEARQREGLGDLRPDLAPPLVDTGATRARLAAYGLVALLLLGCLAYARWGLPWAARRQRPFAVAWRALRRGPAPGTTGQRGQAYRLLHAALNQTAGQVLFAADLDRFLAAHPGFASLRGELAAFFERSQAQFFAGAGDGEAPPDHDGWLLNLCRRCLDVERASP